MKDSVVEAKVELIEMLGSETLLYLKIEDTNFIARVNPRTNAKIGDSIKLAFDANKIHLFDKDSEKTIIN
jgi:multiple sugar transport system ATP-binding protein